MKKYYLLFIFTLIISYASAQESDAFITTWEVQANELYIHIPIYNQDGSTNFSVDYGDGTLLTNEITHVYATPGIYTVSVTGNFNTISFSGSGSDSAEKIKSIEQWGTAQWYTMSSAFANCTYLVLNATDTPDLSQVTTLANMFNNADSLNQSIGNWDVSNVTDMTGMFSGANSFNQSLNDWDVSNVTNMTAMFYEAISFNQPLNDWNVSNVSLMDNMFGGAKAFNQPVDQWNVSNVTGMLGMFSGALLFNQPVNEWDVSNVTNMYNMFYNAISFNQPLDSWDTSGAVGLSSKANLLQGASSFNQDMSSWNYSDLTPYFGPEYDYYLIRLVQGTNMDSYNYDKLLLKFAQDGAQWALFTANNLEYCDTSVRNFLINQRNWSFYDDTLSENCTPNSVAGTVKFDQDANGCSSDDISVSDILIHAEGNLGSYSSAVDNGGFGIDLFTDTYTISLQNIPSYFTVTPETSSVTFTGLGSVQDIDFCLTANQQVNDLNITLIPVNQARPGFEAQYQLVVQNIGTQTVSNVTATLGYEILKQSFVSASQTPALINPDPPYVSFDIASLQPFETKTIDVVLHTNAPPLVNGGDLLQIGGAVTNTNDFTPEDNAFTLNQTVVNAYDPNDKTVLQGDVITVSQLGNYLDYVVRFQNTGAASAITVRIDDVLDANLDWATLRPINASHSYRVEITEGNHVSFIFENINLPADATDEPGSHGFIAFKIKPLQTLQQGDVITGSAAIYFDYNEPIITNTVTTLVLEAVAATGQNKKQGGISIYPNPADGLVHINPAEGTNIQNISVINLQGRILMSKVDNDVIDVSGLSSGIYILSIKTNKGIVSQKLVKE